MDHQSSSICIEKPDHIDLTGKIRKLTEHACAGGAYGDIYKCLYDSTSGTIEVAVKALRFNVMSSGGEESSSERLPDSFRRELGIWRRLDHPNIVPFLGTTLGIGRYTSMVAMWMPNGTLQGFLEKQGDGLSITDQFGLLQGIAAGLEYLHSRDVIHGDLTSNNVLIDETNRARLVDFGFSSVIGESPQGLTYLRWSTRRPGTVRWAAPEQFQVKDDEIFQMTTKSDVYSFGCMMLQVLSGRVPWSEVKGEGMVILNLSKGKNPRRPPSREIEEHHWEFIQECWRPTANRLSATEVVERIERIIEVLNHTTKEEREAAEKPLPLLPPKKIKRLLPPLPLLELKRKLKSPKSPKEVGDVGDSHPPHHADTDLAVSRSQPESPFQEFLMRDLAFFTSRPMLNKEWPHPHFRCDLKFLPVTPMLRKTPLYPAFRKCVLSHSELSHPR